MTTTVLAPYLKQRWVDGNGAALYQGTINTYQAGSLVPVATYKDSTGTLNTNPIVLNARGECDLWLLPNVAYKFIVADVNGNLIPGGTLDNVVNSVLISLYGGVDTGGANAYILTFAANFTSYTDGIQLTWIPTNTNTGASTININGIGFVAITNPDGSALLPNEIIANQPATILARGGAFILTTAATTVYGQFTATWSGFSVVPGATTIKYRKNGSLVTLLMPQTLGTSNSILFVMNGLPAFLTPTVNSPIGLMPIVGLTDNGAPLPGGAAIVSISGLIQFWKDGTQPSWTISGNKGFTGPALVTYTL